MIIKSFFACVLCTVFSVGAWAAGLEVDLSQTRTLPFVTSDQIILENVIVGDERYAVIMSFNESYALEPIWTGILSTVTIPFRSITIDGDNSDWEGLVPVVTDPAGDEDSQYATVPGTDLANVYMARDDTYLYFLMTMHDGDPVQDPQTLYVVEFQQYLTQLHTPGDLSAIVSYTPNNSWTVGVGARGPGEAVAHYPSDHVGIGTRSLEYKVPISAMQFPADTPDPYFSAAPAPPGIENQFVRVYIHPIPINSSSPVSDSNHEFTRPMIVNFYP